MQKSSRRAKIPLLPPSLAVGEEIAVGVVGECFFFGREGVDAAAGLGEVFACGSGSYSGYNLSVNLVYLATWKFLVGSLKRAWAMSYEAIQGLVS
jgi:hypothetical protein